MARFHSNIENYSTIHVKAENSSTFSGDYGTLVNPLFSFIFCVIQKQKRAEPSITRSNAVYNKPLEFERPIGRFRLASSPESLSTIAGMLANTPIPFLLENPMLWTESVELDSIRLHGHEDIVKKISKFARRIIHASANSTQVYNKLHMTIVIEKTVVIPTLSKHDSFLSLHDSFLSHLNRHKFSLMRLRILAGDSIEGMFNEAVGTVLKSAIEALKKFRYCGSIDDHDDQQAKLICSVCMEGLMIGSHVIPMPCSHIFHEYCILKWLERSPTCPICRFNLLVDSS